MRTSALVLSIAFGLTACPPAPAALDGGAVVDAGADAVVPDDAGYAIHGGGWHPPLYRRVVAKPCPDGPYDDACATDDECGAGMACVCSPNVGLGAECVAAECREDADCANGICLVAPGGFDECHDICPRGLYCERPTSTCEEDDWCPGNGTYCTYVAAADRFECSNPTCRCDE